MTPTVERERLRRALAQPTERALVFAQRVSLEAPVPLTSTLSAPHGAEAELFWRSPREAMSCLGALQLIEASHLSQLDEALRTLREVMADEPSAQLALLVGGASFQAGAERQLDTSHSAGIWRGYDAVKLWLPRWRLVRRGEESELIVSALLEAGCTFEQAEAQLEEALHRAMRWIEEARGDVSRETSACGTLDEPRREAWGEAVGEAARFMREEEGLRKVVMARRLTLRLTEQSASFHPRAILERALELHPNATVFCVRPPVAGDAPPARFIGATPECLVRMNRGEVYVDALAGSAPLEVSDEAFLASQKDRAEHQVVIDAIVEALRDEVTLQVPAAPSVDTLKNIKHLRSPLRGVSAPEVTLTRLAARLHPTPAVCGQPRERAARYLSENEEGIFLERGWYAGALGWCALDGKSGEFDVALRCALVEEREATLFVGAGLMPDSDPQSELRETRIKGEAMLPALVAEVAR